VKDVKEAKACADDLDGGVTSAAKARRSRASALWETCAGDLDGNLKNKYNQPLAEPLGWELLL
jgi:hypothetical protein